MAYDWQAAVREWVPTQGWIPRGHTEVVVEFFRRAFEATRDPNTAWFGTHPDTASLVAGGIFLASVHGGSTDRGVWLLTANVSEAIPGFQLLPVRATIHRGRGRGLTWVHAPTTDSLSELVHHNEIWTSYGGASEHVLDFPIGRGREERNRHRGKLRLSEFWPQAIIYPDEVAVSDSGSLREGAVRTVTVNAYERNAEARIRCIAFYGCRCEVCKLDLEERYGPVASGYIHVHHLRGLAKSRGEYEVDPIADLRPVCPNCHAIIHLRDPPYTIEDVRSMLLPDDA